LQAEIRTKENPLGFELEARGSEPVKMAVSKGFGNGITRAKQRRAFMEENEKWFAQYIWGEKPAEPKTP